MSSDDLPASRVGTPMEPPESYRPDGSGEDEDANTAGVGRPDAAERATPEAPTRNVPPESFPGSVEEWSTLTDEEKRIAVFSMLPVADRGPQILVPDGEKAATGEGYDPEAETVDGVSGATCVGIREAMADAETAREAVEAFPDLHTSKVMRHAYGECAHTPPVSSTASPKIGAEECRGVRQDYRQGATVSQIAERWARAANTVTRHIYGRCSHDSDPERTAAAEATAAECSWSRETFHESEGNDIREVACAMSFSVAVAITHILGFCVPETHADREDPGFEAGDPAEAVLFEGDGT